MKKLISALIIVSILFCSTSTITNAAPDTDASKAQLVEVSGKLKELDAELVQTNKEIADLESSIANNQASIEENQRQIENAESKISSLKDEIAESENILATRLREMYKNNGFSAVNYISFLFDSKDLSDLIDRFTACTVIINEDNKLISGLNQKVTQENDTKELIASKKLELENLNEENKSKLNEVNEKKASQEVVKKELEDEQSRLSETITQNEIALISSEISTIDSSSNRTALQNAVTSIKAKLPQFTMAGAINKANDYISKGNEKIASLPVETSPPASSGSSSSSSSSSSLISYSNPPSQDRIARTLKVQATAYTGDGVTATGTKPVRIPSGMSSIAVDPSVIPLNSTVYVEGYGYAIATDTGGAIKGSIIDLYMNSESDCKAWGRRNVTVYVLK